VEAILFSKTSRWYGKPFGKQIFKPLTIVDDGDLAIGYGVLWLTV
jgi:hypothetical protein